METGNEKKDLLDDFILSVLKERPETELPSSFTERLVRRYEKKSALHELLLEFGVKIGIILGSLAILTVCLVFPFTGTFNPVIMLVVENWQVVTCICILIFLTFFIDQVLLRFFSSRPNLHRF